MQQNLLLKYEICFLLLMMNSTAFQIFTRSELELVADLCKRYDVMCLSDEVYEWLVYAGSEHVKIGMCCNIL